jgi:hypothetical protein
MAASGARDFLGIYLNDHLAGAAGGVELARRVANAHSGSEDGERLRRLADDIAADRGALLTIMRAAGVPIRRYKSLAVWTAEKAGRLKLNGRLLGRSPLSDLVELVQTRPPAGAPCSPSPTGGRVWTPAGCAPWSNARKPRSSSSKSSA